MNKKEINYTLSSVPQLKKSIISSIIYSIFMIIVMIGTIFLYLYAKTQEVSLLKFEKIALIATVVYIVLFLLWQCLCVGTNIYIILKLKKENTFTRRRIMFNYDGKYALGNIIRIMFYALTTVMSILAFGFGTYFVLKFIYAEEISFYAPIMFALLISSIYSCVNIDEERELYV